MLKIISSLLVMFGLGINSANAYEVNDPENTLLLKLKDGDVLIQMYPELKSNELVSKQIDIYNENNKKIKKLKLEKIKNQKAKFYLYFGG